jgi:hypothetical protein
MNLGRYRHKKSRFEILLNFVVFCNLILALSLGVLGAILNHVWVEAHYSKAKYIFYNMDNSASISIQSFFSFFLILNSFVPLNLVI